MDKPVTEDFDTLGNFIADTTYSLEDEAVDEAWKERVRTRFDEMVDEKKLTNHEQQILFHRFGIETDVKNLRETGEMFGVTRERIRQIQNRALNKARNDAKLKDLIEGV